MTLGAIIRHHRQLQGLSQPALAQRANIEQSYLSKLENDHSTPSDEILQRLMHALELDIASLYAQLDNQRSDPKILSIHSIQTYHVALSSQQQRRQTLLITFFTLTIAVGVALFYLGHSKSLFPETLYSYESRGELIVGEPSDYYHGGWRRAVRQAEQSDLEFTESLRSAAIVQAERIDYHTVLSFSPLEQQFTRQLDNGNRRVYRASTPQVRITRPHNAWLMFFGIVLAVSGFIALTIRLRPNNAVDSTRQ